MEQEIVITTDAPSGVSPLKRFKGILAEWTRRSNQYSNDDGSTRNSLVIDFKFSDLEVLEADEPYPWPVTTVSINYSDRSDTRWEAMAKSLRGLMPSVPGTERLDKLVGQTQEWAILPATLRLPLTEDDGVTPKVDGNGKPLWGAVPSKAWQVVAVDGIGTPEDLTPYLVELANGKTEQGFNQAAMTDPKVIARPDVVTAFTERKVLDTLLMANLLTRDAEGLLHKV